MLVPFAVGALLTGLTQSLLTRWGLIRHYLVLFKLVIALVAGVVLLLYLQTLGDLARIASASGGVLRDVSPVVHSVAAALLLVAAVVLSVFKPRGIARFGAR